MKKVLFLSVLFSLFLFTTVASAEKVSVTMSGYALFEDAPVNEAWVGLELQHGYNLIGHTVTATNGYFFLEVELPEELSGYQFNVKVYANTTPSLTTTPILSEIATFIFNPEHTNYDFGNLSLSPFLVTRVILVQGKIISEDNLPVGGAVVQLKNANGEILNQITSGVDGYYNLIACGQWLSSNEELTLTVSKRVVQEVTILTNAQQDLYHKDVKIAY